MPVKRQTFNEFFFATLLLPVLGGMAWYFKIAWLPWVAGFLSCGVLGGLATREYGLRQKGIANTYLCTALLGVVIAYIYLARILDSLAYGIILATALVNIHAYYKSTRRSKAWEKSKEPDTDVAELLAEISDNYRFDLSALSIRRGLLAFVQADSPITEPVTKFGGQPVWLEKPQWPLSKRLGKPMHFIGQIALETELFGKKYARMAYIFYSGYAETRELTSEYHSGENAVILQPGGEMPVSVLEQAEGPVMMFENDKTGLCEFAVRLEMGNDPEFKRDYELSELGLEDGEEYEKKTRKTKLGGTPCFYQFDDFPDEEAWQLLCQLNDQDMPFYVDFGTGRAEIFINQDGSCARMMWQC